MAKAELSREAIVDRALAVADAEGLDAVTVRRLATELGVTPMALYWHVKNKDEVLDAMGDRLFETIEYGVAAGATWDQRLHAVVRGLVEAFRLHPVCVDLAYRRVFACDEGLELTEYTLAVLDDAGFTGRHAADIATRALQTALMLVSSEPGTEPGYSDDELEAKLAEKRDLIAELPTDRYPHIHTMADALFDCDDVEGYYDFNVELFVHGARAMLANAQPAPKPAPKPASKRRRPVAAQSSA